MWAIMPAKLRPRCDHASARCRRGYSPFNHPSLPGLASRRSHFAPIEFRGRTGMTPPAVLTRDFTRNDAPEAIDRGHLARMTFGDRSLEREVLALFDRQAAMLIERMRGGEPATVASLAH